MPQDISGNVDDYARLHAEDRWQAATDMNSRQRLWGIFSGSIGNLIEYYDWFIYIGLEFYFSKEFFPAGTATVALLKTAAVLAIGFLVRPIGGWVLGIYADRRGRRAALLLSVSMMCFGSL